MTTTTSRNRATSRRSLIARWLLPALLVGACSMPSDESAQVINLDDDNLELLEPAPTSVVTTTTPPERTLEVGLYFIEDDLLRRQSAQVPRSRARSLPSVLNDLFRGTLQENHRSAIPAGVEVVDARIDETTRTATIVLLDNTLFSIEGNDRLRAIAQVVFTATDRNGAAFGVERVRFEIDGDIRTIPTGGGSDTNQPVGRCDYERFASSPDQVRDCPGVTTTTTSSTAPPPADPTRDLDALVP